MAFIRSNAASMNNVYAQQAETMASDKAYASNGGGNSSNHEAFKLPSNIEYFSWGKEPGFVCFNILPFMVKRTNQASFMYHLHIHEIQNPAGGRAHRYVCMKDIGKACPVCNQKDALDTGDNYNEIKAYVPKNRTVMLVQPIVNGVPQNKIQLLECASKQKGNAAFPQKLMAQATMMAMGQGVVPFADLDNGKVVCVQTAQDSFNGHNFVTPAAIMFQDRQYPISDEVLAMIPDYIEDIFNLKDSDAIEMETLINGGDITVQKPQMAPATSTQPGQLAPQAPAQQYHEELGKTPEEYAALNGQMAGFQRQNPNPSGPMLTEADFGKDPYQAPARSFPSETPVSNGFIRSRV